MQFHIPPYITHTQPFYGSMDFVWDNPGEPVPEETFTHSHLSWSSIVPYLLLPSNTIHGILLVQSMCLTIFFHNPSPSFLWSTSWTRTLHFVHTYTHTHTTVLLLFWNMSGTTRVSRYQKGKTRKVKTNLDLLEQEIVSGSDICWAICKSAPHPTQPRQYPATQPTASKH